MQVIDTHSRDDICKLVLNAEIENKMFTFVNIYAPNNENERHMYFDNMIPWIRQCTGCNYDIIIAGDFNCCLGTGDRSTGTHFNHKNCNAMKSLLVFDWLVCYLIILQYVMLFIRLVLTVPTVK